MDQLRISTVLILVIGLFTADVNLLFSESSIKAIIFDCDGTLVASEEASLSAWRQTLQNRGCNFSEEQFLSWMGKSDAVVAKLIAESIGDISLKEEILAEQRGNYFELQKQGLPSIEATVDFLKRIAAQKERLGLKLGVASASIRSELLINLKNLGIEEFIDVILSGYDDLTDYADPEGVNKPKPYIYIHAAKLLQVSPEECVVIEDSMTGVLSGRSAGCITVAIPNRYTEDQDLSAATLKMKTLSGISVEEFLEIVNAYLNKTQSLYDGAAHQGFR